MNRLTSTMTPIGIRLRVLIGLLITYLLSPPTLQVGADRISQGFFVVQNPGPFSLSPSSYPKVPNDIMMTQLG